ncbi:MAG: hypothetical protein R2795_12670 [Saprospiraceae bacterium]
MKKIYWLVALALAISACKADKSNGEEAKDEGTVAAVAPSFLIQPGIGFGH